ncbi:periplasmic nitrate reductase, NapE protein [Azospirillum sp. sgz302134]
MNAPFARSANDTAPSRRFEGMMFLALSVLIWPFLAIGVVGAYGLAVWMYQVFSHTPGM